MEHTINIPLTLEETNLIREVLNSNITCEIEAIISEETPTEQAIEFTIRLRDLAKIKNKMRLGALFKTNPKRFDDERSSIFKATCDEIFSQNAKF